jgi:hypothetical protein
VTFLGITSKERILRVALIALILGFFVIPLVTFFGEYYKPWAPKPIASILIVFFR